MSSFSLSNKWVLWKNSENIQRNVWGDTEWKEDHQGDDWSFCGQRDMSSTNNFLWIFFCHSSNTKVISLDAVLYLYSAVTSRLSDFFFPFSRQDICKHIVLILRFNAYWKWLQNKHRNCRVPVNLAMTEAGAGRKVVRHMGTYLHSFQQTSM